jgi:hypothetical protein
MRRVPLSAFGLIALLLAPTGPAEAQFGFPRGYGRYGWGGFNVNIANDPAAGYMAGLGSYARDQGTYQVENANARAINAETMLRWNQALRARQRELRAEQQQAAARREAEREARVKGYELRDGTTLNNLLLQVLEFDPGLTRSSRAGATLNPAAIREIPFEWDSEAITICIDQMTGKDSLPGVLMDPKFVEERNDLRAAVEAAIREDTTGSVSPKTSQAVSDAIDRFRDKFVKGTPGFDPGYSDSSGYFSTLASLVRLLNDPSMKKVLGGLEDSRPRTLGDLIAFMNAYNLRFGPSASPRQVGIYEQLIPALTALRDGLNAAPAPSTPADKTGDNLKAAARGVFQGMGWDQLQAHARSK